jgi:hypothetical protein
LCGYHNGDYLDTHTERKSPALHNRDADVFGPVEREWDSRLLLRKFKLFAKYKENQQIFVIF